MTKQPEQHGNSEAKMSIHEQTERALELWFEFKEKYRESYFKTAREDYNRTPPERSFRQYWKRFRTQYLLWQTLDVRKRLRVRVRSSEAERGGEFAAFFQECERIRAALRRAYVEGWGVTCQEFEEGWPALSAHSYQTLTRHALSNIRMRMEAVTLPEASVN
jgi:hypothetical protein